MAHASAEVGVLHLTMALGRHLITSAESIMPRFYFDIADGGLVIDDEGTEYPDAHAARAAAIATLPDVARDVIGEGKSREVIVLIRDESNRALFTASLTLSAKWLVETP